jgi:hypothetical protein
VAGDIPEMVDAIRAANTHTVRADNGSVVLHFIASKDFPLGFFSVAVSAAFGSAHRACAGPEGVQTALPEGVAHLIEHVVLMRHWRRNVTDLTSLGARVNGRVDLDRTYWWAAMASVGDAEPEEIVSQSVAKVLSLVVEPIEDEALPTLLEKARKDVVNEIGYRQSRRSLTLWTAVFRALYPSHPLGDNPLGTEESLASLGTAEVRLALDSLAASTCMICVLMSEVRPSVMKAVEAAVAAVLERSVPATPWRPRVTPLTRDPPEEQVWIEQPWGKPTVAGAFELEPLPVAYPDRSERAKMLVAMLIAGSGLLPTIPTITSVSAIQARVFLVAHDLVAMWLKRDLRRDLKYVIRGRLIQWRRFFDVQTSVALMAMRANSHTSMRLCHQAALHGLEFDELLTAARGLSAADADCLLIELEHAQRSTQVYVGPELVAL